MASDGWFTEKEVMWPGQRFGLQVKEVLHQEKSEYQDILVFDSTNYGRVLVLDGCIQLTERDEFAYQEMMVHVPLMAHPNPQSVLIVGAGDGGVLREVVRHAGVKRIVQCEIDRRVVEVSKQFFPTTLATSFDDPRVELLFKDAAAYMEEHQNEFDVIIVDSSDPVGPAETLYTSSFYANMHRALRAGGIVCTQGECQFLHLDLIERVMRDARQLYENVDYGYTCVPTYPSGQIGFILASKSSAAVSMREPKRAVTPALAARLRYYSEEIHRASFILPRFAEARLAKVRSPQASSSFSVLSAVQGAAVALGVAALVMLALPRRR